MFKFIVISDLHVVPEGELSHSIDTAARLQDVVEHINANHADAAFCAVAGDLTDHGEVSAYERARKELGRLMVPCYPTIGNHDDRDNFDCCFPDLVNPETYRIDRCFDVSGQRVIMLDSVSNGEHGGSLTGQQLEWVEARLMEARDRPAIVILHHNITKLMVSTDGIRLLNGGDLVDVLKKHDDIRHVISGHVHLTSSGTVGGIPFTTISGNHYNIAPLQYDPDCRAPRHDGPSQIAVVWSGKDSTVVLMEDFQHRQVVMPKELFYR